MSVSYLFTFGTSGGSTALADSVTETGNIAIDANFTVPVSTTNQAEAIAWNNTNLTAIYIKSNTTLTLKTNSSSSPQDTLTITGGVPFIWYATSGITNPFAGNVTNTFWSNSSSSVAATVYVRGLTS